MANQKLFFSLDSTPFIQGGDGENCQFLHVNHVHSIDKKKNKTNNYQLQFYFWKYKEAQIISE